jgi:hypothetical protein
MQPELIYIKSTHFVQRLANGADSTKATDRLYQTSISIRADEERKIAKIATEIGIWEDKIVLVRAIKAYGETGETAPCTRTLHFLAGSLKLVSAAFVAVLKKPTFKTRCWST